MKKKLLIILIPLILFGFINVNAAPEVKDRGTLDNYGVNKKWKITEDNKVNIMATPLVDAKEKIYDFSGVLQEDEIKELQENIGEFIEKYNMDLAIVITSLPYSVDSQNEDFAADFYDYNDFGINYKNYDGILLFRNTYAEDPYYDMYTFGRAQLYFDQDRYDNILDSIYNDLHAGEYLSGFKLFIDRTSSYMNDGIPSKLKDYDLDENGFLYKKYTIPLKISLIISFIISTIIIFVLVRKNKMIMKASEAEEYLIKESTKITTRKDKFITSHTSSYTISNDSGSGGFSSGGSSHSSSGSSGGGHSSGGGRHG